MKEMGKWTPIPTMLEWWIPLAIALPFCIFFLRKAWRYRETYSRWMIVFHFFYLGYCITRGVGAVIVGSRLRDADFFLRVFFLVIGVFLIKLVYEQAKRRFEFRRDHEAAMVGPEEALWSPDPIVGFRWSINSMHEEPYTGSRAFCREEGYHSAAKVPMWGCRCGYYAMKQWGEMGSDLVVVVFMWGRVIEHAWGYRSEYMRPIGYFNTHGKPLHSSSLALALSNHSYFENFIHLPLAQSAKELDALIEKASKEFDPAAPPPYDGGYHGHR